MIQTIDLRGVSHDRGDLAHVIPRARLDVEAATAVSSQLMNDVRTRGVAALLDQAERLDGVRPPVVRIDSAAIDQAVGSLRVEVREALQESIRRVRLASVAQLPSAVTTPMASGAEVVQRWRPVGRVGLYAPGGKAVLASSVVMNVVPAQVAGVDSIALASPPQKAFGGSVHPTILAAAGLLGVDEVYAMGGAGAIGALAYGVADLGLDAVDLVTGPGNIYVAAAKRLVRGVVGIDAEAGPTEILVIADDFADPVLVAADLVSQAEHDELAAAVLVTDSVDFADRVRAELGLLAESALHGSRVRAALDGQQSAIVVVDDLGVAAALSNAYAPEHLEIQTKDPDALLGQIENAGAIFVGESSPVSLGDYLAGSNHVLPTGGQARFTAGLGVYTFLRAQQVIRYDHEALSQVEEMIVALAQAEDLPAHAAAVTSRVSGSPKLPKL